MVAATRAHAVDVWRGTALVATIAAAGRPTALYLGAGGLWVGAGCRGRLELWRGARRVGVLEGHGGAVTGVGVDAEGRLVSASVAPTPGRRALWRSCAPARLA